MITSTPSDLKAKTLDTRLCILVGCLQACHEDTHVYFLSSLRTLNLFGMYGSLYKHLSQNPIYYCLILQTRPFFFFGDFSRTSLFFAESIFSHLDQHHDSFTGEVPIVFFSIFAKPNQRTSAAATIGEAGLPVTPHALLRQTIAPPYAPLRRTIVLPYAPPPLDEKALHAYPFIILILRRCAGG